MPADPENDRRLGAVLKAQWGPSEQGRVIAQCLTTYFAGHSLAMTPERAAELGEYIASHLAPQRDTAQFTAQQVIDLLASAPSTTRGTKQHHD